MYLEYEGLRGYLEYKGFKGCGGIWDGGKGIRGFYLSQLFRIFHSFQT